MTIPINPDYDTFFSYVKEHSETVVPLVFKFCNDGLFAWSAFAHIEREYDFAFLLESADTGENGRYSLMGSAPRRRFVFKDSVFTVYDKAAEIISQKPCMEPMDELQAQLKNVHCPTDSQLPPFISGVVGYAGYDCVHYFEPVGEMKTDELNVPDMLWMQTDILIVFDHYRQELYLIKSAYREDVGDAWKALYDEFYQFVQQWSVNNFAVKGNPIHLSAPLSLDERLPASNYTREDFFEMVLKAKEHIYAGDVFQIVLSQRFNFPQTVETLEIYRRLRRINPSPYMFYLKCGDFSVIGSSPELMLSCRDRNLLLRPIAGTRPRGTDEKADQSLAEELVTDEKEKAEHLMLVDLGRNDLGRVAKIGSVTVPDHRFSRIEKYSHVMHMVTDVTAVLASEESHFSAAKATFPAGTLSGAPKVRAMQIINTLEPCKRNLYGGFLGLIGHDGSLLTCIVIRTLISKNGHCYVQAGGGIVADSDPEKEYQETVNKARAVLRAAYSFES